jgi:hypothetical protein
MLAAMRRASSYVSRRALEIGAGQRLPAVVPDDEGSVRPLDGPGRREAACLPRSLRHHGRALSAAGNASVVRWNLGQARELRGRMAKRFFSDAASVQRR